MTSSVIGPRRSSKAITPPPPPPKQAITKTKLAPKKMGTVWWSAAGLTHYSFLNYSETTISEKYTQQIDEMHPKLQYLKPALVNRKGQVFSKTMADCISHNQGFKN